MLCEEASGPIAGMDVLDLCLLGRVSRLRNESKNKSPKKRWTETDKSPCGSGCPSPTSFNLRSLVSVAGSSAPSPTSRHLKAFAPFGIDSPRSNASIADSIADSVDISTRRPLHMLGIVSRERMAARRLEALERAGEGVSSQSSKSRSQASSCRDSVSDELDWRSEARQSKSSSRSVTRTCSTSTTGGYSDVTSPSYTEKCSDEETYADAD
jgi:hypothetical protein